MSRGITVGRVPFVIVGSRVGPVAATADVYGSDLDVDVGDESCVIHAGSARHDEQSQLGFVAPCLEVKT